MSDNRILRIFDRTYVVMSIDMLQFYKSQIQLLKIYILSWAPIRAQQDEK